MTDATEIRRLSLQIERDLLAISSLRTLLAARVAITAVHRQDLRDFKARMTRRASRAGRAR